MRGEGSMVQGKVNKVSGGCQRERYAQREVAANKRMWVSYWRERNEARDEMK